MPKQTMRKGNKRSNDEKDDQLVIEWSARQSKRRNDAVVERYLQPLLTDGIKSIRVLSMPARDWIWEKGLVDNNSGVAFDFTGVEREPSIRKESERNSKSLNAQYRGRARFNMVKSENFRKALELAEKSDRIYDIIYADYMDSWSREKLADVETLFNAGLIKKGGYFIMTLSLMLNSSPSSQLALDVAKGFHDIMTGASSVDSPGRRGNADGVKPQSQGIPRMIIDVAEDYSVRLHPFPEHIYYNARPRGESYPEVCLCFRRL